MKTFIFVIETRGQKTFEVKADSAEQACNILANCDDEKKYLIESEDDWNLDAWSREPIEKKLVNNIEDEYEEE